MRARPPAQKKGSWSEKLARNVGAGERFDLIIMGNSKSERIGPFSRSFQVSLVIECLVGWVSS